MIRVRNARDFLSRFRLIAAEYDYSFAPLVSEIRARYSTSFLRTVPGHVKDDLEAHRRVYFVNAFLAALNWRLDVSPASGLPNLIPEAAVKSAETGRWRFLDYLGFERQTNKPLLVVETKRSSAPLPRLVRDKETGLSPPRSRELATVLALGLEGRQLFSPWNKWLSDLRDYIKSIFERVGAFPARCFVTNGTWLIIFGDPANAFGASERCNPDFILVFETRDDVETKYEEIFRTLDYGFVAENIPPLVPGELAHFVSSADVARLFHALYVQYISQPGFWSPSPVINVAPVVYLQTRHGAWIRVEDPPIEYGYRTPRHCCRSTLQPCRLPPIGFWPRSTDALAQSLSPRHYLSIIWTRSRSKK